MARTKSIQNRAELILQTAAELFSHYGYERTSIDDIAEKMGIGKGSIYLEFRTKEDILMRIIENYATRIQAQMDERVENLQGSPLATLKDIFSTCVLSCYDNVTRDFHSPETLLHTSLQFKARFSSFYIRKRERVLKLLKAAAKAGEISQSKATEETAVCFLMAISSLFPPYLNNYTENEGRISREALAHRSEILLDIVIAGLKSP